MLLEQGNVVIGDTELHMFMLLEQLQEFIVK